MLTAIALTLYVLTAARLTRLLNHDTILDGMRLVIGRRARNMDSSAAERVRWSKLLEFLGCPWCVGFWLCLALSAAPIAYLGWPWWSFAPLGVAASHIVGTAAPLSSDDEVDFETVDDE